MNEIGYSLSNYMDISSLEGIKQGVIHGLGILFISKLAVTQDIQNALFVEVIPTNLL